MRLREIVYLLLGLLIGVAINAGRADVRIEGGVGKSAYQLSGDDIWWQSDYPNIRETTVPSFSIGGVLTAPISPKTDVGIRIRYHDLGQANISGVFISDEDWFAGRRPEPTWSGSGHGKSVAYSVGVLGERRIQSFGLQLETGLALVHSTWNQVITYTPTGASTVCSAIPDCNYDTWKTSPYVGAGVRYKWLLVSYRMYYRPIPICDENRGWTGVGTKELHTVIVGVSIPI